MTAFWYFFRQGSSFTWTLVHGLSFVATLTAWHNSNLLFKALMCWGLIAASQWLISQITDDTETELKFENDCGDPLLQTLKATPVKQPSLLSARWIICILTVVIAIVDILCFAKPTLLTIWLICIVLQRGLEIARWSIEKHFMMRFLVLLAATVGLLSYNQNIHWITQLHVMHIICLIVVLLTVCVLKARLFAALDIEEMTHIESSQESSPQIAASIYETKYIPLP